MATWEEILGPISENRINATRPQAKTPAVIRRKDVFGQAFQNVRPFSAGAQPSPGGWRGVVSDVLESPVGSALTKVGEVVSLPGRAVTSGLQEIVDVFDNDPTTSASWNDFTKQVADPTYGFGKVIGDVTGNKWADRLIGFAGDVLLDPLTYMTLGSTKALKVLDDAGDVVTGMKGLSVASSDGRIALAKRVLEQTGDKALSAKVARYGRAAIKDPSVFERIGLDRAGLYFMGKRMPGSTKIGEAVERGFATMRTWAGDHMFKRSNELFTLADASAARKALLRGSAMPDDAADYLYTVISSNAQRAMKGSSSRDASGMLEELVNRFGTPQFSELGKAARRAMETGTIGEMGGMTDDIARGANQWFEELWNRVNTFKDEVDPQAPLGKVENYVPTIATDRARRDIARGYNPRFTELKEFVYNPLDPAGSFRHRMQVGDDFFGYTLQADDVGNIDRLNAIAREFGKIDYDFFETDLLTIMSKYVDMYSDQMGVLARKKYLIDKGVFQKLEPRYFIDEDAWKQMRKTIKSVTKARSDAAKKSSESLDNLVKQIESTLRAAKAEQIDVPLASANRAAASILKDSSNAKQVQHLTRVALKSAYDDLAVQRGTLEALVGERPPQVVLVLEKRLEEVIGKIEKMSSEIDNLTENGVQYAAAKIRSLQQEIADIEQKERLLEEFGNLVESKLDDIIAGKEVAGLEAISGAIRGGMTVSEETVGGRRLLISGGIQPAPESRDLYKRLREFIKQRTDGGDAGRWTPEKQRILERRFQESGGVASVRYQGAVNTDWWKNANVAAQISATEVADMTPAKVADVVTKAMRGEASIRDMRKAILSIASNDADHPRDIWLSLFGEGAEGAGAMSRAAQAEQFFSSVANLGSNRNKFVRLTSLKTDADAVLDSVASDLSSYAAASGLLKRIFSQDEFDPNLVVPAQMLREYLAQPEFASLRNLFSEFIDDKVDDVITEAWSVAKSIDPEDVLALRKIDIDGIEGGLNTVNASGLRNVDTSLPELTFGEMSRILRGVVDNIDNGGAIHSVTFSPTGPAQNLMQGAKTVEERTLTINAANYTDQIYYMLENGEEWGAISKRIEDIVYGQPPKEVGGKVVKGVTRVQKYGGEGQALWTGGVEEPLEGLRREVRKISEELNRDFAGFVDVNSTKLYNQNGEPSSVSFILDIGGKKKSLSKQAAEEAQRELSNLMLEFWFKSEVSSRFSKAMDLLQPFGVAPTMDYHRRIVNEVAKRVGTEVAGDLDNLNSASTAISRLIAEIREEPRAWVGREKELFDRITNTIGDYGDVLARYGGRADAGNIYKQWNQLGGARPAGTGIPKKINAARRTLSNPTSTAEQRLEAQNFLNASRSLEAIADERDKFYKDVVVKWYRSSFGYEPSNRMEATAALREMSQLSTGYGRLAENAPYQQQLKWLETVSNGLTNATRDIRKNRFWVIQAQDPFLDYSKLRIGRTHAVQNLPSMYSAALMRRAEEWDAKAALLAQATEQAFTASSKLSKNLGKEEAARAAQAALSRPRASLEGAAEFLDVDVAKLTRARKVYLEANERRSSLEYVSAVEREELNDLLIEMARFNIKPDNPIPAYRSSATNAREILANGEPVFVLNNEIGKRGFKRINSAGGITGSERYYTFVPTTGYPNVASAGKLDDRIKSLRREIASAKKDVDDRAYAIDNWYSWEKKRLSKRDLDAKRNLDAELRQRRQDIAVKRVETEQKEALVADLQKEYDSLWREIGDTYRGNISHRKVMRGRPTPDSKMPEAQARMLELEASKRMVTSGDFPNFQDMTYIEELPIKFSQAEYNSLFLTPQQFAGSAGSLVKRINDVDGAIAAERRLADEIEQMISAQARITRETGRELRQANMTARQKLIARRAEIESRVQVLQKKREELVAQRDAFLPEVRQAALEKARIMNQLVKDGVYSRDEILYGMKRIAKGATPEEVDARVSALTSTWGASVEKKYLDSYRTIENSIQYELASSAVETVGSSVRYAEELRNRANEAWGMFADDGAPWGYIEKAGQRVPREKPVLGVAGIHRRLTETDVELRESLAGLSEATGNQINAIEKFEQLTVTGMTTRDAIEQIISEAKMLRPENAVFLKATELAQMAAKRQELMDEVGFWTTYGRQAATVLYGGKGSFKDLSRQKFDLVQQAKRLRAEIDKYRPDWDKSQAELIDFADRRYTEAQKALAKAELDYTWAAIGFDQAQVAKMDLRNWYPSVVAPLRAKRNTMVNHLDTIAKIASKEADGDFRMGELLDWLDEFDGEIFDFVGVENYDAIKRLRADALAAHERAIMSGDALRDAQDIMKGLENHEWGAIIEYEARKGWKELASSGLPSYQARREIARIVENFSRIQEPAFVRSLNKFIGTYTGFFKAYATATPGFIVRNTISNSFSLVAAGADPRAMAEGLRIFREWNQALKSNSVEGWLSSMKPARRAMVEETIRVMDASGYGRVGEAFSMWRPNRKWLVDNRYISAFRNANQVSENSARFILGWDSIARNVDFDTAVARVKRHLFDYQNVSAADEVLRSIIPFWFWMSRNLPLQLTNQWINPKAYSIYKSFTRAVSSDEKEDPLLPSWMREQGAIRLGGDIYLTADLGFQRVQEQLSELSQPKRLLSYVNPALRLPVELLGGRKLYSDVPFSGRGQEAMGGPLSPAVQALAEILGQSQVTPEGQLGVTEKLNYALRNLVPPLAQAERLVPATEYGQQAQLSSILGYLGVPLREVTPLQRESEQRRQQRESRGE